MPTSEHKIEVDVTAFTGGIQIIKTNGYGRACICTLDYEDTLQLYRALRVSFSKIQDEKLKNIESCIKEVDKQLGAKKEEAKRLEDRHRELVAQRSNVLREEL